MLGLLRVGRRVNFLGGTHFGRCISHLSSSTQVGIISQDELTRIFQSGLGEEDHSTTVIDVRSADEIHNTGALHTSVLNIPLDEVLQGAMKMSEEDWESSYGAAKPEKESPLVFSCAAGIRSDMAARVALDAGYTRVFNYRGGARDWFSP